MAQSTRQQNTVDNEQRAGFRATTNNGGALTAQLIAYQIAREIVYVLRTFEAGSVHVDAFVSLHIESAGLRRAYTQVRIATEFRAVRADSRDRCSQCQQRNEWREKATFSDERRNNSTLACTNCPVRSSSGDTRATCTAWSSCKCTRPHRALCATAATTSYSSGSREDLLACGKCHQGCAVCCGVPNPPNHSNRALAAHMYRYIAQPHHRMIRSSAPALWCVRRHGQRGTVGFCGFHLPTLVLPNFAPRPTKGTDESNSPFHSSCCSLNSVSGSCEAEVTARVRL